MTVGILGLSFFWTVGILAQKFTVVGKLGVGVMAPNPDDIQFYYYLGSAYNIVIPRKRIPELFINVSLST